MSEENNKAFFSKLTSHYDALAMVKDTSTAFIMIGCVAVLTALFTSLYGLVDAAVYLAGAFFLRRYESRAAAWTLLVYAGLMTCMVVGKLSGASFAAEAGGASPIFALVGLWAGTRAVEATTKLKGSLSATARNTETVE